MKRYFKDIDNSTDLRKLELMIYEWARLESFNTFPRSSSVSCLRLAKSGFYYTGNGEQATCFCCGVSNDSWNTNESVHAIHKRISPNCKFVKGEETKNVPIHINDVQTQLNHSTEGASGGPMDIHNATNRLTGNCVTGKPEHKGALLSSVKSNTQSRKQEACRVNEQPKHHEYATKAARMASFTGWPSTIIVQPEELSVAGFFYAGKLFFISHCSQRYINCPRNQCIGVLKKQNKQLICLNKVFVYACDNKLLKLNTPFILRFFGPQQFS